MFFTSARSGLHWTSALLNAIVMAGAIRGRTEGDKSRLSHGIALEPLLFFWPGYGLYDAGSSGLKGVTKLGFCFGSPAELTPSVPLVLSKASGPCLDDRLNCLCFASVVARSCSHSAVATFDMPRLHHRMRCRRGTPRRAPSSPSSISTSLSSDFITGHYPHTRSGRGRLHLPNHYPEPRPLDSTSSPTFGPAIFTFNCSLNHPRITAHVSVFFHEEAQEVGDSSSHQEGPGSVSAPNLRSVQAQEVPAHNAIDVVMKQVAPGPSENEVARARGPA